jgi:hypothetical protein
MLNQAVGMPAALIARHKKVPTLLARATKNPFKNTVARASLTCVYRMYTIEADGTVIRLSI